MDHPIALQSTVTTPDFSAHKARERLENESCLLNMARYGTAVQLCRVRCGSALARDICINRPQAASYEIDEDGFWVLKGRFTPEQGAVIRQALEKAMDALVDERQDEHPDVSAETPRGELEEWQRPQPVATRRADALERLAESFLAGEPAGASSGDRYVVNIHADAEVLTADGEAAHAECDDCGRVSAETSRRMACDAAVVHWYEDENGEPLSIGRKSRTIPPAIRRALQKRDGGHRRRTFPRKRAAGAVAERRKRPADYPSDLARRLRRGNRLRLRSGAVGAIRFKQCLRAVSRH